MGISRIIRDNSRKVSDMTAGTADYFELATTNLSLYRAVGDAAREYARGKLLDAGAGRMAYRETLKEFCESYESLDVDNAHGANHVADLQDTKLPDAQYDSIFCTQVLQHLPEPQSAINEIARMLKPGGRAVFTVPHLVWMHNEPHDYLRFTKYGMEHMLNKAGLKMVKADHLGGLICFLAYAPSTFGLALLQPLGPVFRAGLMLNSLFIRAMLLLDKWFGMKSLYPTNVLVVADRPE